MFGLGDLIAQSTVENRNPEDIDWLRTVRYASIGCALGPSLTMWYRTLDRLGTKITVPIVTKKILVDQLAASPIITGSIMTMSRVFSGDEWPQIQKKLEDNYVKVMLTSYTVNAYNLFYGRRSELRCSERKVVMPKPGMADTYRCPLKNLAKIHSSKPYHNH